MMASLAKKAADKLAKAGGCLTSIIGQGLLAKSAIKRELKEAMLAEWTVAWKSGSEGRQTKVFWTEPDLKKGEQLMKLSRPRLGIMAASWLRICPPEKTVCHHRTE
jgi:hypothetical protein